MKLEGSVDCAQGAVRAVRYNVEGDYILTCGSNKTVKLWNAKSLVSHFDLKIIYLLANFISKPFYRLNSKRILDMETKSWIVKAHVITVKSFLVVLIKPSFFGMFLQELLKENG